MKLLVLAGVALGAGFTTTLWPAVVWLAAALGPAAGAAVAFPYAELTAFAFVLAASGFMLRWIAISLLGRLDTNSLLIAVNTAQLVSLEKLFLAHDLTVRGLDAPGDIGARAEAAIAIYTDVQTNHAAVLVALAEVQEDLKRRRR